MCRFIQRLRGHLGNNKGIALVSVLVVSTVLALVGSSYLSTSTHEAGLINQQVSDAQLLYAAEAGKEMGKRVLRDSLCGGTSLESSYSNQFTLPGQSEAVQLAVNVSPSGSEYFMTSTAEFKGVQKKITATLSESDTTLSLYNYAIYAKEVIYGDEDAEDSGRVVRIYRRLAARRWGLWFPRRRAMVRFKQTCLDSGCHSNYYVRRARYYYGSTGYWKPRKMRSTGLTETMLTDSHADFKWREELSGVDRFNLTASGWQLVPNVKQPDKVYPITAYTRHTITVSTSTSGDMLYGGATVGDRYRIEFVLPDSNPEVKFYTYDSSNQNTPISLVDKGTVVKEGDLCLPVLSGNGFNKAAFINKPGVPVTEGGEVLDDEETTVPVETLLRGDIDLDGDVDGHDVVLIMLAKNLNPASPEELARMLAQGMEVTGANDRRDLDGNGKIDWRDARVAMILCSRPICGTTGPIVNPGSYEEIPSQGATSSQASCVDGGTLEVGSLREIKTAMSKHRNLATQLTVKNDGTAACMDSKQKVYTVRGNTNDGSNNTIIGANNKVTLEGNTSLKFDVGGLTLGPNAQLVIHGNPAVIKIEGHLHLSPGSSLTIVGDGYIEIAGHIRIDRGATLASTFDTRCSSGGETGNSGNLIILSAQSNIGDWVDSDPAIFLAGSKWRSKGGSLVTDGDLVVYNPEGDLVVKRRGQLSVGGKATFNLNNFIVKRKGFGHRHRNRTLSIQRVDAAVVGSTATLMTKCDKHVPHTHFKPTDADDDEEDRDVSGADKPKLANRKHFCKGHHFPAEVTKSRSCRGNPACHVTFRKLWKARHPAAFLNYLGASDYFEVDIAGETILATHGGIYLYHGNLRFGDATAAPPTTLASYGNIHIRRSNVLFNGDLDIDAGDGSLGTNDEPEDSFIMFTGRYAAVKFAGKAMIEHNGAYMDLSRSKLAVGDEKVEIYGNRVINIGGHRGLLNVLKLSKISNWASWRDSKFDFNKYLPDQMRLKDTSKLLIYNTGKTEDGARTATRRTFFGQIYSPNAEVEVADLPQALEDRIPSYFWGAIASNETVTLHKQLKFYYDLALEDTRVVTVPEIKLSQWVVVPPSSE